MIIYSFDLRPDPSARAGECHTAARLARATGTQIAMTGSMRQVISALALLVACADPIADEPAGGDNADTAVFSAVEGSAMLSVASGTQVSVPVGFGAVTVEVELDLSGYAISPMLADGATLPLGQARVMCEELDDGGIGHWRLPWFREAQALSQLKLWKQTGYLSPGVWQLGFDDDEFSLLEEVIERLVREGCKPPSVNLCMQAARLYLRRILLDESGETSYDLVTATHVHGPGSPGALNASTAFCVAAPSEAP